MLYISRKFMSLCLASFLTCFLVACTPSSLVRLSYDAISPLNKISAKAPSVSIILFDDQRARDSIGNKKSGIPFLPANLVAEWITQALRDELLRLGANINYEPTAESARATNPSYLLTGVVHDVWLQEITTTSYTVTIRITVTLADSSGSVLAETISASQEFAGLPSAEIATILFANTLQDLLLPASQKLLAALR